MLPEAETPPCPIPVALEMTKLAEEAPRPRKRVMETSSSDLVDPSRQLADISIEPEGKCGECPKDHVVNQGKALGPK
jgi:hypothetical protein